MYKLHFSQRALAEITEMIRTSNLIHRGLVNINNMDTGSLEPSEVNNITFGNKIALLCGDYLLSNSCTELAALKNQDVSIHASCLICFMLLYCKEMRILVFKFKMLVI